MAATYILDPFRLHAKTDTLCSGESVSLGACLLMMDLIFSVGSIGFRKRARCDVEVVCNAFGYDVSSPISASPTPVSPIRGASRQN